MASAAGAALLIVLAAAGGWSVQTSPRSQPRVRPLDARLAEDLNRRLMILAVEDSRDPTPADVKLLLSAATRAEAGDEVASSQAASIRAIGRLERRDLIPVLLKLAQETRARREALEALIITLRAHASRAGDEIESATSLAIRLASSATVLAHLPYTRAEQLEQVETRLMDMLKVTPPPYGPVAAALEVLARKYRKLHQFGEGARAFLKHAINRTLPSMEFDDNYTPRAALAALAASGLADEEFIQTALRDRAEHVRRTGMIALDSAGSTVEASVRTELTRAALSDPSPFVRYEALRAWIRRETTAQGCAPLIDALSDDTMHVVLAALDGLGERCPEEEAITDRLFSEARTPPTVGAWQREAHAFVALARRSAERASTSMPAFISHIVWQVRMYAARAAAAMKDVPSLERLARDAHDNVREATLQPLRMLKQSESDGEFVAALSRPDYQLLRTAANALEGAEPNKHLVTALVSALERVSAEKKDTSRDTRLALLERIRAMGGREQLTVYERLLKDFDPKVAAAAAEACTALSSQPCTPAPQLQRRPPLPRPSELSERVKAVVELDNGRRFNIHFDRELAPLACTRFMRLARAHYYDGLTFHRIVPNFIIQGGSPGANEYAGDGPYMRDELGGSHTRGTIGISTRGRDTGDAQIFINLVDNPRLDYEYTVFAAVPQAQLDIVDDIQEGTRIVRINFLPH